VQVAVWPDEFMTVPVKVMPLVSAGVVVAPPATGVIEPMPLSMAREDAFAVVQVSVEASPDATDAGDAMSVQIGSVGGGGGAATAISVVH